MDSYKRIDNIVGGDDVCVSGEHKHVERLSFFHSQRVPRHQSAHSSPSEGDEGLREAPCNGRLKVGGGPATAAACVPSNFETSGNIGGDIGDVCESVVEGLHNVKRVICKYVQRDRNVRTSSSSELDMSDSPGRCQATAGAWATTAASAASSSSGSPPYSFRPIAASPASSTTSDSSCWRGSAAPALFHQICMTLASLPRTLVSATWRT